jgi:hypothetical protein
MKLTRKTRTTIMFFCRFLPKEKPEEEKVRPS